MLPDDGGTSIGTGAVPVTPIGGGVTSQTHQTHITSVVTTQSYGSGTGLYAPYGSGSTTQIGGGATSQTPIGGGATYTQYTSGSTTHIGGGATSQTPIGGGTTYAPYGSGSTTQIGGGATSQTPIGGGTTYTQYTSGSTTQIGGGATSETPIGGGATSQTHIGGGGTSYAPIGGGATSQTHIVSSSQSYVGGGATSLPQIGAGATSHSQSGSVAGGHTQIGSGVVVAQPVGQGVSAQDVSSDGSVWSSSRRYSWAERKPATVISTADYTIRDERGARPSGDHHEYSMQRSAQGNVTIGKVASDGSFVIIENTSMDQDQHIGEWTLRSTSSSIRQVSYTFPRGFVLTPQSTVQVFARGRGIHNPPRSVVCESDTTFATGDDLDIYLYDNNGQERARLTQRSFFRNGATHSAF
ncbi:hypothetical protein Y032_0016g3153 [Ancylostoma ceylanicum]|uniref:LTD domain-containing protein n=1 Tax=Ancylostoma ceylanicum TaxID=53326 RepID=A0A016V7C1_9BILA|nr:hypothetical protein Y032_0016g3153 [Ancylostoma ceylanicum]